MPPVVQVVLDAAVKGALVILVAAAATALLRHRSAALRHAIWTAAIAAQLALPLAAVLAPSWSLPLLPAPAWLASSVGAVGAAPAPRIDAVARARTVDDTPQREAASTSAAPSSAPRGRRSGMSIALPSGTAALALLWAAGAAVVLLRLAVGTMAVARLARSSGRVSDGRWLSLAQRLADRLRIARPLTLMRGGALGVPVTWGIVYPVILLPADADTWDAERRRYVLVHEMAHVRRLDALTQMLAQLVTAVFWFNPLVWLAAARMRLEREHACDDYVLREGITASRYADDLLAMVRMLGTPAHRSAQPAFAALAMARRTDFEGRVLAILDPHQDRHPLSRRGVIMSSLATLLLVVPLAALSPFRSIAPSNAGRDTVRDVVRDTAPALPATRSTSIAEPVGRVAQVDTTPTTPVAAASAAAPGAAAPGAATSNAPTRSSCDRRVRPGTVLRGVHTNTDDDGGLHTVTYSFINDERCIEAQLRGAVGFNAEGDDVAWIAEGGRATFRERVGGMDRVAVLTPGGDGQVLRALRANGDPVPFDGEARAWLGRLVTELVRESAIEVKPRVQRIRARGGVRAVLTEVDRINSPSSKRAHLEALLDLGSLDADDLEQITARAARHLESSGDLAAVLRRIPPGAMRSPRGRTALGVALSRIDSDGDRRAVLTALAPAADRELLVVLARSAAEMSSDGDKGAFLRGAAAHYLSADDDALRSAYFAAVSTIESDGDHRAVLTTALPFAHRSPDVALAVFRSVEAMSSSGDQAGVLVSAAEQRLLRTPTLREAYMRAAQSIRSDGDARRVLAAASRQQPM